MERHVYRELLQLVNDPNTYMALQTYMDARRALLLYSLEHANDTDTIRRLQGALAELARIATLKEEVQEGAK